MTASELATQVLSRCKVAALTPQELEELIGDMQEQIDVHGPQAIEPLLKQEPGLRGKRHEIERILHQGGPDQTLKGLGGAGVGALLGGLGGGLLSRIVKGREMAVPGALFGTIPGAVAGYVVGKRRQQQSELQELLRSHLKNS